MATIQDPTSQIDIFCEFFKNILGNHTDEFVNKLKTSGYFYPNDPTELSTISRDKSIIALGEPQIMQLNSDGEPIEIWTLHNAWIKSATFGNLAYANDDTVELSIVLVYDFATIEVQ